MSAPASVPMMPPAITITSRPATDVAVATMMKLTGAMRFTNTSVNYRLSAMPRKNALTASAAVLISTPAVSRVNSVAQLENATSLPT